MSTSTIQAGLLCLRMASQPPTRMMVSHFSSMTRSRVQQQLLQRQSPSASSSVLSKSVQQSLPRARFVSTTTSSTSSPNAVMPWAEYFRLRKSRRTWGTVAAIPTTIAGVMIGGGYFANLEASPNELIFGIEPIWVYSGAIVACVALGWLSGPMLGNALWKLRYRQVLGKVEHMDNVFLAHIKKKRVDPSRQSVNNPVPDYYGEKIGSMKNYRQWLRDQATYRRKATFGAPDL
ncbi:Pam17-domain-containing protein [Cystobasidium minutum MCA 4210]|uniref:Pam17-domain-containing protein n=1 Tax=Cystobasidium minutum MCA 4210 TaxID=1397322 RepID=UPI0034CDB24A|eukprot:jgi/Rhomi1/172029/fgenesh1_kg.4_\